MPSPKILACVTVGALAIPRFVSGFTVPLVLLIHQLLFFHKWLISRELTFHFCKTWYLLIEATNTSSGKGRFREHVRWEVNPRTFMPLPVWARIVRSCIHGRNSAFYVIDEDWQIHQQAYSDIRYAMCFVIVLALNFLLQTQWNQQFQFYPLADWLALVYDTGAPPFCLAWHIGQGSITFSLPLILYK